MMSKVPFLRKYECTRPTKPPPKEAFIVITAALAEYFHLWPLIPKVLPELDKKNR